MAMEIFREGELEEEMRRSDMDGSGLSAWWHLFRSSYKELVDSIAFPARADYSLDDLGPPSFVIKRATGEVEIVREDFQLQNVRQEKLECSLWRPACEISPGKGPESEPTAWPCIVYLHGMSSSRKECVYVRDRVLASGFSLFTLDMSGSGKSEGDRVSFGHFEQDDLRKVVDYLYATGKASAVGLWGRGFGGATALLHARTALSTSYKTWTMSKREAKKLRIVEDKYTGHLLCARPSSVGLPFRMTRIDATNGDFVMLSVGNIPVDGMTADSCLQLIEQMPEDIIRIAGYTQVPTETQDNFIFGLVLDSTYGDLTQVVTDMLSEITKSAEKRDLRIPSAMMGAAGKIISHSVHKMAGYHFKDIHVMGDVTEYPWPCLFVYSSQMDFISPAHTIAVCDVYGGPKKIVPFDGGHDQNRPGAIVEQICAHFVESVNSI